uniref:RelA/SpoT domain-containing protein n=1 Tax=Candidatus Kentrum sp. LFY TaxID=2126342 RepID=A0A450UDA2_9GAMM|nr:MAG: hypothetical protein BECKLFY1418A_GA0070994_101138 [Candidatus Kentron sp. LFY]
MRDRSDQNIAEQLKTEIESELSRAGLLFRVFARAKSHESIQSKLSRKSYGTIENERKMQDLYGVRIALYFPDDSDLAQRLLKSKFEYDECSSTIDLPTDATFGPTRSNLIFRLPKSIMNQSTTLQTEARIDGTFEVQFRTVFSEGWHEIDHDLRYRCKNDWNNHKDLNRAMNGFIATLETCDWAVTKLFDDLAWRHYKAKEWLPMLRTKFRLRWQSQDINHDLENLLNMDNDFSKSLFKVDRQELLAKILESKIDLPINPSNLVYLSNFFFIHSEHMSKITPRPVTDELENCDK